MILEAVSPLGAKFGTSILVEGIDNSGLEISELSNFGVILCTSAIDVQDVTPVLIKALEIELPVEGGAVIEADNRSAIWLSPRSWLLLFPLDNGMKLIASINGLFPDRTFHASAYSDYLCWLSLKGIDAADILQQGGFISLAKGGLPVGHAKRTIIAGLPTIIHHNGTNEWTIGIDRSYASYFTDWLRSCCT